MATGSQKTGALIVLLLASLLASCSAPQEAGSTRPAPSRVPPSPTATVRPTDTALPPTATPLEVTSQPAHQPTQFELDVKAGSICKGSLAVEHSFSVFLSNAGKSGWIELDAQRSIMELPAFAWSPDGRRLAVVNNHMGDGNIYTWDAGNDQFLPLITDPAVTSSRAFDYLAGVAWSNDGKKLITWGAPGASEFYMFNKDGTGFARIALPAQFFETPRFAPDDKSVLFYGADRSGRSGLFQDNLESARVQLVSALVEGTSSFAWSQDGARLAYIEMDRDAGEARLVVAGPGKKTVLAALAIQKGAGLSNPEPANMSWSPDGKTIVFEFKESAAPAPSVYLAHTDGTGVVRLADSAHAPAISADGRCLAYIRDNQVFLIDSGAAGANLAPVVFAGLPDGRGRDDRVLDRLQWEP